MTQITRRSALKTSLAGGLSAMTTGFWTSTTTAQESFDSPNEQPVVAFIGTGIRFHTAHGKGATEFGPCAAVCDVDMVQLGRAMQVVVDRHREKGHPLVIASHEDYRHVLDRKDVDAVIIGTTDHWHTKIAIDAMRAGKDVYCEKPLTLTIREGEQIEKVLKETDRVFQVGTQQRTEYGRRFAKAVAMAHDGRVGKIKQVTAAINGSRVCDPLPVVPVPKELNWDMWLGQAPMTEYRQADNVVDTTGWGAGFPFGRAHRYYRWFYEYSGGKLTDWGAHHVDISMWAMDKLKGGNGVISLTPTGVEHPVPFKNGMPTVDDQFNTATKFKVEVAFQDGMKLIVRDNANDMGFQRGIMIEGEKGRYLVNRAKLVGKPVENLKQDPLADDALDNLYGCPAPESHMRNFMECIKTRKTPISDVVTHNRMLDVCHAVNISLRLNRPLKYDADKREFVGDAEANRFVAREQRKGYEINA